MKKGFVFTLDSFVGLLIAVAAIYSLFVITGSPPSQSDAYLQAHYLAKDTIFALYSTDCGNGNSCLEQIGKAGASNNCADGVMVSGKPIEIANRIISAQYGYKIEFYDSQSESGNWVACYDTANALDPAFPHATAPKKFEATAKSPASGYKKTPEELRISCGSELTCEFPSALYSPGEIYVGLVRVTVYI